jgi:hypothetical protein
MTVYESLAHALLNEHGRGLFTGTSFSNTLYGFSTKMWRWLLAAYGEKLSELPAQMGLPAVPNRPAPYNFPTYTIDRTLRLGIPLKEVMQIEAVRGYTSLHTPIQIATGLMEHGTVIEELEAEEILQFEFLRKFYKNHSAQQFVSAVTSNPYAPTRFGLQPYPIELLLDHEQRPIPLDSLGSAAWFPKEYLKKMLHQVEVPLWYGHLCRLNTQFGQWTDMVGSASYKMLYGPTKHDRASGAARYIRNLPAGNAEDYFRRLTGVREGLRIVRHDASVETMASGLKAIVGSARNDDYYTLIGRALTIEDFRALTPKTALLTLYSVNYEVVRSLIEHHSEELGALFFTLTGKNDLPMVMNSMSPHAGRAKAWHPDTPEGNVEAFDSSSKTPRETWDAQMKPLIEDYIRARDWRHHIIELGEPAVIFLALMLWASQPTDPVPRPAITSVLRSHHSISLIEEAFQKMPEFYKNEGTL